MKTEKKKSIVGIATVTGMGLCFLGLYYAGDRLGEGMQGPSKIASAPDGTIWVASHGGLHHFTATGERREVVALSALGLGPVVSELLPLPDGTLVLAEAVPSGAYRCNPGSSKCTSITAGIGAAVGPTAHALMVAADEKRGRYYISDNANHRLILADFDGKVLDVTAPRRVLYPNELAVEKSGELVVVDTTHRRLLRIGVERDAFGPDLWQMKTDSGLSRPGRRLPMDLARSPDGGWWVLVARDGMKEGDVILFGGDGNALRRIDLGSYSDPTQIAVVSDGLLVADPTNATLIRVAPEGRVAGPWGDAAFQSELDGLRGLHSLWRAVRLAAQLLIVAIPLAGMFALWRLGERLPALQTQLVVPANPAPVEKGIHWLEVLPQFKRRARRLLFALFAVIWLIAISLAWLGWQIREAIPRPELMLLVPVFAVFVLMPLVLLIHPPKAWRMRLGTDGQRFFLDPANGKVEEYSFSALAVSDGRQLLVGKRLIPLRLGLGPLFAQDELSGYIFARIPLSGRVGSVRLLVRALDQGSRELWWVLIVLAIVAAFVLVPMLFPSAAAYFWNIASHFLGVK